MAKRIAFFGPAGTYTEEADLRYNSQADLQPFPTIGAVGMAVSSGMTEEGVVPIENSLEGSVTYTLDLLISQSDLSIYKEILLPIQHYLMTRPGTSIQEIQVIYSHPQSLAQCRNFLERCFPNAHQSASLSNATAVADMKGSELPAAAIAPRRAAELYGAEIIGQNIQGNSTNVTRFVVLAPSDHPPTGQDRTSICFSFERDAPGQLYRAIGEFAQRDINLVKVESRPARQYLWRYIFLLDCEGHRDDPKVKEALDALRAQASMLKVMGSYPRWNPTQ